MTSSIVIHPGRIVEGLYIKRTKLAILTASATAYTMEENTRKDACHEEAVHCPPAPVQPVSADRLRQPRHFRHPLHLYPRDDRHADGSVVEGEVESWRDYDDGDQLQVTINGVTYLTHASNVVLMD